MASDWCEGTGGCKSRVECYKVNLTACIKFVMAAAKEYERARAAEKAARQALKRVIEEEEAKGGN